MTPTRHLRPEHARSRALAAFAAVLLATSAGCEDAESPRPDDHALRDVSPWEDCGPREWQVEDDTGAPVCTCQPRFAGPACEECAGGYAGDDCASCAEGYRPSDRLGGGFDPDPDEPRDKSWAAVAWELRCEPVPARDCDDIDCGDHGSCDPGDGFASCVCDPGHTGASCDACAPLYELDAVDGCVLGDACRDRLCGGAGDCVADAATGAISCDCDAATDDPRCEAVPDPIMVDDAGEPVEWHSLYPGESVGLDVPTDPASGMAYASQVVSGPVTLTPCAGASCPPGADVLLTVDTSVPGPGVTFARVRIGGSATPLTPEVDLAIVSPLAVPITGTVHPELATLYDDVLTYMRARGIRGGAIGVSKGGVTIARNGFGYRDPGLDSDPWEHAGEGDDRVLPHTPFRLASLSKPVTAAAVRAAAADAGIQLTSVSQGTRAADLIAQSVGFSLAMQPAPYAYSVAPGGNETRWGQTTVRHLINHHAGFVRDVAHAPTVPNRISLSSNQLPNLTIGGMPQTDLSAFNTSFDLFFSTGLYAISALNLTADPYITSGAMVRLVGGISMDYPPGGNTGGNDNYSNFGYSVLGRVLEGIEDVSYDPEAPGAPYGWGPYAGLVQDFLCPMGIGPAGFFPGADLPRNGEPAYRELDANGDEVLTNWNVADPRRMRSVQSDGDFYFESCNLADPDDCHPLDDAGWTIAATTPAAYGSVPMGVLGAAGGWVANVDSYLRFARRHRTSVGAPNDPDFGTGSPLVSPGQYPSSASHNGSLQGTWTFVWQLGGENRNITLPFATGVWSEDLPASAPVDNQGLVVVNESLRPAVSCALPDDVAVVVLFNQRQDYRAPSRTISPSSNSTTTAVYARIRDFVYDGICDVASWPMPAPNDVLGVAPSCP